MKIMVLNNADPFIRGGAEELADELVRRLNGIRGVRSELLRLPFAWSPPDRLIDEILIHQTYEIENTDRIIALKFPAYLVRHENKTLWLLHQFRQAYDLYDAGQSHLGRDARGKTLKEAIRRADNACYENAKAIFCNSPVTRDRLKRYNGFDAEVLYPPLNDGELFTGGEAGDYIFAGGRVSMGKRQHLLIEAMALAPKSVKLVIAGPPESAEHQHKLEALVDQHSLGDRVRFDFGYLPRAKIAAWANGALACACLPFDEDSLSYVAMEGAAAGKAILTTTDSGGVLGLVDDETGYVCAPEPQSIAEAMARIHDRRQEALDKGRSARQALAAKGLSWANVLEKLLVQH
jgi:glycosyltransferase involved in cell wall biosynthesis